MQSLEEVYRTHFATVYRVCSRYCKSREEAEDLAQETFLRIERNLGQYRGESTLSTWIYSIATNCCLDHLRRIKTRERMNTAQLDSVVVLNLNAEEDRILARMQMERILGKLRPSVRQILFLCLAEGLSYQETSEVTGISREAVAKTVMRFLKKQRQRGRVEIATAGKI